jgi:hypothetical protein
VIAAIAMALAAPALRAYETDQYSNRLEPISDAEPALDRAVNDALGRITERWRGDEDRRQFAFEVYTELGGLYWVDRIERYAMKSPAVEKLPQYRWHSIFRGAPIWATRVNWLFGIGDTIRIGDSLLGTDKLGHFVSQGLKYYRSHLAGWSEERVAGRGRFNERWIFGQATTSVFSNADLVANWEGYRFYRSLFEDGVAPGKGRIVEFRNGRARLLRDFRWSDHVNDFWDEALNTSFLSPGLARFLRQRLPALCGDYRRAPGRFLPANEGELRERYRVLGMRTAPEFRLDQICKAAPEPGVAGHG